MSAKTHPRFLSQAEFARSLDVSRKTATQWKKQGFLVLNPAGKVDVEATLAKLGERAGSYRGGVTRPLPGNRSGLPTGNRPDPVALDQARHLSSDPNLPTAEALRRKENFLGLLRQLEFEREAGRLVPLDKVKDHIGRAFINFRREIERMPDRHVAEMAAQLGCDPGALDEALRRMIHATLTDMSAPVLRAGPADQPSTKGP